MYFYIYGKKYKLYMHFIYVLYLYYKYVYVYKISHIVCFYLYKILIIGDFI